MGVNRIVFMDFIQHNLINTNTPSSESYRSEVWVFFNNRFLGQKLSGWLLVQGFFFWHCCPYYEDIAEGHHANAIMTGEWKVMGHATFMAL